MNAEETIRQAKILSGQISVMADDLQKRNSAREFELIWTTAKGQMEQPAMERLEPLKKTFELFFAHAYRAGAVDMAVLALEEAAGK